MEYRLELTDTFGGEANYSWVRRATLSAPDTLTDRALIRRAKRELGLTGMRCRVERLGETIALYPAGACMVAFIDSVYP